MILVEIDTATRHQLDALIEKCERETGTKATLLDMVAVVVDLAHEDVFGE